MRASKGPEFIRFFKPILEVMKSLGGSGTASKIVGRSIELAKVTEEEQQAVNKNGLSRIKNQEHWARQYLVWGVWNVTDAGQPSICAPLIPWTCLRQSKASGFQNRKPKEAEIQRVDEPAPVRNKVVGSLFRLCNLPQDLCASM